MHCNRSLLLLLAALFLVSASLYHPGSTTAQEAVAATPNESTTNPTGTYYIPMRDGTKLATDVYVPDGDGPFPVIFIRFPYNKALGVTIGPEANRRGYCFVAQDTRGRYLSEGANLPFDADGQADGQWDGYDSAQWISEQPWCNGRIGTWGGSAGAITQYLLAGTGHPNVVSQHLVVGAPSLFQEAIYRGGIFRQAMVTDWIRQTRFQDNALDLWTSNFLYNQYWKDREITHLYSQVRPAGMHIGGWYDIFAQATVDAFLGYQNSGSPSAQGKQKLIMGPWTHHVLNKQVGQLVFPNADRVPENLHDSWLWFDATLKDQTNAVQSAAAVTYYVMGDTSDPNAPGNRWRSAAQWPPFPPRPTKLLLNGDRSAVLDATDSQPAASTGEVLSFHSDPENPVPTLGGYELTIPAGAFNQEAIESRQDLLVFTTPPLTEPLEVTGNVLAHLLVECSQPDADLIVRLCDVYPDGKSYNICEGALRLRFREGLDKETHIPVDSNRPVPVKISCWPTSIIFNKGHSLRVHIAASNSPALQPNRQNGLPPNEGAAQKAEIKVHLGSEGSYLLLPTP